jgi:hypothetical protein
MTLAFAALVAGFVHVLSGPDHLAAMAPYAVEGKSRAWRTGVRWGLGHSTGVVGVGLVALLLRDTLHVEALSAWGELCVGVVLIAIGIRAALAVIRRSRGRHEHESGAHGHAPFAIGTVHGLAGSSHVLGIAPALVLPTDLMVYTYLTLFGVGSIAAMGLFSSLVGRLALARVIAGMPAQRALLAASSVVAVAVGGFWLFTQLSFVHLLAVPT